MKDCRCGSYKLVRGEGYSCTFCDKFYTYRELEQKIYVSKTIGHSKDIGANTKGNK